MSVTSGIQVAVLMGSLSDEPVMKKCLDYLDFFGISYEVHILSAHRNPEKVDAFASDAENRGIQVIIAGAGMAAALPGVIAARTTRPVIGVPLEGSALGGQDALYSIVQMPPGIPVATVGIGNAKNAGLMAAHILAIENTKIRENKVDSFPIPYLH